MPILKLSKSFGKSLQVHRIHINCYKPLLFSKSFARVFEPMKLVQIVELWQLYFRRWIFLVSKLPKYSPIHKKNYFVIIELQQVMRFIPSRLDHSHTRVISSHTPYGTISNFIQRCPLVSCNVPKIVLKEGVRNFKE